jgi:hypothetical protein
MGTAKPRPASGHRKKRTADPIGWGKSLFLDEIERHTAKESSHVPLAFCQSGTEIKKLVLTRHWGAVARFDYMEHMTTDDTAVIRKTRLY